MKIHFELEHEGKVLIKCGEMTIGHIFTPAGSIVSTASAIQVCGFDEAFDLWGCHSFAKLVDFSSERDKKDVAWQHKKDIQLMFSEYKNDPPVFSTYNCLRCYNAENVCSCENKNSKDELPFTVKRRGDLFDDPLSNWEKEFERRMVQK